MAKSSKNDVTTKSTDFLPGKPNLDGLSSNTPGSNPPLTAVADQPSKPVGPPPANASAHIIDLKSKTQESPADSPLLAGVTDEPTAEPTVITEETPKESNEAVKVAVGTDTKGEAVATEIKPDAEPAPQAPQEESAKPPEPTLANNNDMPEKKMDDLNLADKGQPADQTAAKPKKGGKLKWILIIVGILVIAAVAAMAVMIITSAGAV